MKGFDCATPLTTTTAASFAANGYGFVARYLVPSGRKALTKEEVGIIQAAGIKIVSVFETTADRALGGRDAGLSDGSTAKVCAANVGQPAGTTIYGAVDFDPTTEQMPAIIDYIRGFNDATPDYSTGVYGSYDVITAVKAAGAASHFWQTYAWSKGQLADCQIYQWQNGAQTDEDKSYGSEGWWGTDPVVPAPLPAIKPLDPGVTLTVINTWMSKSWFDANKAGNQDEANYIKWLADQMRLASGLPVS